LQIGIEKVHSGIAPRLGPCREPVAEKRLRKWRVGKSQVMRTLGLRLQAEGH
jgi:hypothetical protein